MPSNRATKLATVAILLLAASRGWAGKFDNAPAETKASGIKFSGLFDARFYSTGRDLSWLKGGSSPLRYGGRDTNADGRGDRPVVGASIAQGSLVLDADVPPAATVHVQANFTTEGSSAASTIGIVEAYGQVETAFERDALRLRAGGFIPAISLENPGTAWSTRYTLTPSPIASWVGEEIRALGAEGSWERTHFEGFSTRLTAGAFSGGDQIGRLLWFRGWSLSDYQGDLHSQYVVQGRRYSPLVELDGRPGAFGRVDLILAEGLLKLDGGYWTNNGDDTLGGPGAANLDSQVFRTHFWHGGAKVEWQGLTLIGQMIKATVSAVDKPARDWNAACALASLSAGPVRVSARYDRFWVLNWENGHAYTGYAAWVVNSRQEIGVEFVYSNARPHQSVRPRAEINRLTQLNYRFRF